MKKLLITTAMLKDFLSCFEIDDLLELLTAFGQCKTGNKSVLLNRTIELLDTRPIEIIYSAYETKIIEIHETIKNKNNISSILPSQSIHTLKFKELQFYDFIEEIIKPTPLIVGLSRCTLESAPLEMKESKFFQTLSYQQVNFICMHRDISNGKDIYPYQCVIRICRFESEYGEVTDYFPTGLSVRIGNKNCRLPPAANNTRPGFNTRRLAGPINCTLQLKLSPVVRNCITINWVPDENQYAFGMHVIRKLSADVLINNLKAKEPKSIEETKNYIIKKLENPDLAAAYYNFSLICPLSNMRMKMPARSIHCDHIQCFDAESFISMNVKKLIWLCPICANSCLYDDIEIDNYFLEVVTSSRLKDDDIDIILCADGSWKNVLIENMNNTLDTIANSIDFVDLDSD